MDYIKASVKYLANTDNLGAYTASKGGGDVADHDANYETRTVHIHNARISEQVFDLDRQGFLLTPHVSAVEDFYSDTAVTDVYENEVKDLVKRITGVDRIEIFDHTRRAASLDVQKTRQFREPASTIHNDYTISSGPKRLRDFFVDDPELAEDLLSRRFAIVNVWRSINGTIFNTPLCQCDASTIAPEDLIAVERRSAQRVGELQLALYNPDHRWYYYPHMSADEVLLFKTYDSAQDGRARFSIHTAVDDPTAPSDAPARESIETRCFVFY